MRWSLKTLLRSFQPARTRTIQSWKKIADLLSGSAGVRTGTVGGATRPSGLSSVSSRE